MPESLGAWRVAVLILCARLVGAQGSVSPPLALSSTVRDSITVLRVGATTPLSPRRIPYARVMLGAVAVSSLVALEDGRVMREVVKLRANDGRLNGASALVSSIGGVVPLTLGATLWTAGALTHDAVVRRTGMESTQSVLLTAVLTSGIKGLVGRGRPNANQNDPDTFSPGRGFTNSAFASFPSGHTSASFAIATVLSHELSGHFPKRQRWIRGLLFGAATTVGVSRVYENVHWPSDIVTGAALGTLGGMYVLRRHPGSP